MARDLPPPAEDLGGFRVDTNSPTEVRRWVFGSVVQGISELGISIREPRHLLKLCGTSDELASALPAHWTVSDTGIFMASEVDPDPEAPSATGYRLRLSRHGVAHKAEIRTEGGELAASGYAAETSSAFVYDRIETAAAHRRRGLGRAIMAALGFRRKSPNARQLLVATPEGEHLYLTMGWRRLSPYATARLA